MLHVCCISLHRRSCLFKSLFTAKCSATSFISKSSTLSIDSRTEKERRWKRWKRVDTVPLFLNRTLLHSVRNNTQKILQGRRSCSRPLPLAHEVNLSIKKSRAPVWIVWRTVVCDSRMEMDRSCPCLNRELCICNLN